MSKTSKYKQLSVRPFSELKSYQDSLEKPPETVKYQKQLFRNQNCKTFFQTNSMAQMRSSKSFKYGSVNKENDKTQDTQDLSESGFFRAHTIKKCTKNKFQKSVGMNQNQETTTEDVKLPQLKFELKLVPTEQADLAKSQRPIEEQVLKIEKQVSRSQRAIVQKIQEDKSLDYSDNKSEFSFKLSEPEAAPVVPKISLKQPYLKKNKGKQSNDNSDLVSILTQQKKPKPPKSPPVKKKQTIVVRRDVIMKAEQLAKPRETRSKETVKKGNYQHLVEPESLPKIQDKKLKTGLNSPKVFPPSLNLLDIKKLHQQRVSRIENTVRNLKPLELKKNKWVIEEETSPEAASPDLTPQIIREQGEHSESIPIKKSNLKTVDIMYSNCFKSRKRDYSQQIRFRKQGKLNNISPENKSVNFFQSSVKISKNKTSMEFKNVKSEVEKHIQNVKKMYDEIEQAKRHSIESQEVTAKSIVNEMMKQKQNRLQTIMGNSNSRVVHMSLRSKSSQMMYSLDQKRQIIGNYPEYNEFAQRLISKKRSQQQVIN